MSMFPGASDEIYRNEAGEVVGWSKPSEPEFCDVCGGHHSGAYDCEEDYDYEEEDVRYEGYHND